MAWVEKHCRVPEGKLIGQPLKLTPHQREDFYAIYDNKVPTRLAILSRGRKNAKTAEAAFILLLHLCGPEARPNSGLYSAAQSRDQAAVLFSLAWKMVRMSSTLRRFVKPRASAKILICPELGTEYRALSADASTSYGLSPAVVIHDELGQVKGPRSELYDALETATAAQEEPLSIVISTQAPSDGDLLSILIDDALAGHDPAIVVRLHTASDDLDPFSEEAIRAANPAFDYFMNKTEVFKMRDNAKRMPSKQASYENLVLNRRVEANAPFVSRVVWNQNEGHLKPIDSVPVYCGLDLSSVNDLTAFVAIGKVDGVWQIHPTFWLPEDGLLDKAQEDRVPYDLWHQQGFLNAAPGKSVDYDYVAQWIIDFIQSHDVYKIAYDRWGFKHLRTWLVRNGMHEDDVDEVFEPFGQGFQSMAPALNFFEGELLNKRVAHGGHPVLKMCAANARVLEDPAKNRKLAKNKSSGRIDGMVATAMAMGVASSVEGVGPSVYEERGLLRV
jgi:phage terminase large subunit-like protein